MHYLDHPLAIVCFSGRVQGEAIFVKL